TTSVTTPTLTRTIYISLKGTDVIALQDFLISKGYLPLGNNTGFFGPLTRSAVQKYQCDKGIVCSGDEATTGYGLVGAKTRALMNAGN
ncbi:MAG: peptidoglycan-binding domain-containing protein, partial [Minisyncoccia bacterium]